MVYADKTTTSSARSREEIERALLRYGATEFLYASRADAAVIQFKAYERTVRFLVPLPDRDSHEFRFTPSRGLERTKADQERVYEQAVRQKWRALLLVVKAKLEAVDAGIVTFEQEFLPHIVIPGSQGLTVYETVSRHLSEAYALGDSDPFTTIKLLDQGRR